jgi:soluble lytic murein transglycosylase-like protein
MNPRDVLALVNSYRGNLDAATVLGIVQVESDFNERAFMMDRNGGSYGLMQIDAPTARDRGYKGTPDGLYDPAINIRLGCAQLTWITNTLRAKMITGLAQVAAAYNEGVENVVKGNPDPQYVAKVIAARTSWQSKMGLGA